MGYTQAEGMKEAVGVTEQTLVWHLTVNHYPPLHQGLAPTCLRAIELANEDEWEHQVRLPEGVTFQDQETAPVAAVISNFHLEAFLD